MAVAGCAAFALAPALPALIAARVLIGMGVAACLMAPLTCYRQRLRRRHAAAANSWMLMTGSLGMLASTLPVQWLLPLTRLARPVLGVAGLLLLAMLLIASLVRADGPAPAAAPRSRAGATATSCATRCSCAWRRWASLSTAG